MKKYPIYQITVYDHASALDRDDVDTSTIDFFGVLYKQDKIYYYLSSCVFDRDLTCEQNDCHTVLKSAVIKKKKIGSLSCQTEKTQKTIKIQA